MGIYVFTQVGHRNIIGSIIDILFGGITIIFGIIGFYGTLKMNEFYIRIFWYWSIAVILILIGTITWSIIEFIMVDAINWLILMIIDLIISVSISLFIAYKVTIFYNLVFGDYQQLNNQMIINQNKNKPQNQPNNDQVAI